MTNTESKLATHIIFGLGSSGLSCARYFDRISQEYYLLDTRAVPPGFEQLGSLTHCIGQSFGELDDSILDGCKLLVVSPGIALSNSLVVRAYSLGIDVCGDVEVFARNCSKKIVAITGSNGKSTVTELTEKLLNTSKYRAQKGGNIGLPVLDFLPSDNADIYVLELSSFQLDTTDSLRADVAVLLNVSEDHMDRYETFNDYANSKKQVFSGAKCKVFNQDDTLTFPREVAATDLSFSKNKNGPLKKHSVSYLDFQENGCQLVINGKHTVSANLLALTGLHNWQNALVSLSILDRLNIEINDDVISELINYQGLEHRFQLVSKKQGCIWINDSKATNVGATIAALNSIVKTPGNRVFLIAGGDSKNADLSELKSCFESKVDYLILLGRDAHRIGSITSKVKAIYVESLKQAVSEICDLAVAEDIILLSPACASLDMYKNFEERGRMFVAAIEECA